MTRGYGIFQNGTGAKGISDLRSFGELDSEQTQRESSLLSRLMGDGGLEDLVHFEADRAERQNQLLFQIVAEIEDTESALKQTEQLILRLKKHLEQLKGLQRVLSK